MPKELIDKISKKFQIMIESECDKEYSGDIKEKTH